MKSILGRCLAILLLLALHAGCEAATSRGQEGDEITEQEGETCSEDAVESHRGFEKDGLFHVVSSLEEQFGTSVMPAVQLYNFSNKGICEQIAQVLSVDDLDAFGPLGAAESFQTTRTLASGDEVEFMATEFKILRVKDQTYRKVNRCGSGGRGSKGRRRPRGPGWGRFGEPGEITCVYPRSWTAKSTQIAMAYDPALQNFRPPCEKTSPFDSVSCVSRRAAVGGIVKMTYPRSLNDAQPVFQLAWHIGSPSENEMLAQLRADPNLKFSKSSHLKMASVAQTLLFEDKVPVRAIGFAGDANPASVKIWGLTTPHIRRGSGLASPYSVAQFPVKIYGGGPSEKIDGMISEKMYRQSTAMMGWNTKTLKREPNGTGDEDSLSTEYDHVFTSTVDSSRPLHVMLVWTADESTSYLTDVQIEPSGQIRSIVTKRIENLVQLHLPVDLLQQ
jgi:hypothetical protein